MTKYLTQDLLRRLNNKAIKYKYNRSIQPSFINEIPEDIRMPVTFTMPHNDSEMRCKFVVANPFEPTSVHFDDEGEVIDETVNLVDVWLDMSFRDYDKLPEISNGTV